MHRRIGASTRRRATGRRVNKSTRRLVDALVSGTAHFSRIGINPQRCLSKIKKVRKTEKKLFVANQNIDKQSAIRKWTVGLDGGSTAVPLQTLNDHLLLEHGSDRHETLPKRVSDDSRRFVFDAPPKMMMLTEHCCVSAIVDVMFRPLFK